MEKEKTQLVRKYIKKFDGFPKKSIARKLVKDYPDKFKDVEDARANIRRISGAMGDYHLNMVKDKTLYDDRARALVGSFDGWEAGDINDFEPYQVPKNITKIGYLSDLHIPYHDRGAILTALDFFLRKEVDCIILNGDIIDCYMLSRFQKDPTKRSFKGELDLTRDFLERLREVFSNALILFKEGNHEERFEAILKIKAPELYDVPEFKLDVLLRLNELDIIYLNKKRIIQAGKLNVLHGHEFGRQVFSPVNPARGFYMRAKENILAGHHHQSSKHSEPSLTSKPISAWSLGCLSDLHPEYMPINKWNLGFGVQTIIDDRGNFRFDNKEILVEKIDKDNNRYTIV